MRLYRQIGNIKAALFIGAVVLVFALLLYTQSIIDSLREESRVTVALYARLITKAGTELEGPELEFVFQEITQKAWFPLVLSDPEGNPTDQFRNVEIPSGEDTTVALRQLIRQLDSQNEPIPVRVVIQTGEYGSKREIDLGSLHYGDSRLIYQLGLLPYIEIGAVALLVLLGFIGFQVIRNKEKQHIWFGMARETAHQLGTPVSSLMGWLERLRAHPEEQDDVAREMQMDVGRLKQISDRFARMGSAPRLQKVDIREVVAETMRYFERRIPQMGKDVVLHTEVGEPLFAEGTSKLISWALENVVKNAIDSIDKPKGQVTIGASLEGKEVVIFVTDNGIGIPRRDWKNVFRPGYTTKERGWGLGLSLTRRIVEEFQKGTIRIRSSEPGRGTTLEIRVPAAPDQD